jgi:hypothetical protein
MHFMVPSPANVCGTIHGCLQQLPKLLERQDSSKSLHSIISPTPPDGLGQMALHPRTRLYLSYNGNSLCAVTGIMIIVASKI